MARDVARCLRLIAVSGLVVASVMSSAMPGSAEPIPLDGDDIIIDGQDYRLEGVDAFEGSQICEISQRRVSPCGDQAKAALAAVIEGHTVTCIPTGKRHRDRLIANCTADGLDIQAEMVRRG